MAPPPPLPFQQALALLQSGQHRRLPDSATATAHLGSSTNRVRSSSESSVPIFSYQQALAMLQHGEHRAHSLATSHQPSMHHQTTLSTDMHDRPHIMPTQTSMEWASHSSGLRSAESMGPFTPVPSFQEALARLHQINAAVAEMYNSRSRLQTTISRYPQETHSAVRQVRSNGERPRPDSATGTRAIHDDTERHGRPTHQQAATLNAHIAEANGNISNVADWQVSHLDVHPNLMGGHRQHSSEAQPSMILANLPSLSFEEAWKTINWRSATKLEIMNCGICLDDFEREDEVHLFPNCNHLFHVGCVKDWLLRVGSCPCCRGIIINMKDPAQQ